MTTKTIREIALAWKSDKQRYVKQSTYAAYVLILENHILPSFGDCEALSEKLVQEFVLQKLNGGLSIKTVKDILIVLKMVIQFLGGHLPNASAQFRDNCVAIGLCLN